MPHKSVSKEWIKDNVWKLTAAGGQITLDDIDDILEPKGGFEYRIQGEHHIMLIPGAGWATVITNEMYEADRYYYDSWKK